MKVKDMTVADVLKQQLYYDNLKSIIKELRDTRRFTGMGGALKRHPIDRLQERGVFEPGQMTVLYAKAIDKELQGYSSNERKLILQLGARAFNKTMKQLIAQENETARN